MQIKTFVTEALMFKMNKTQKIYITGINWGDSLETSSINLSVDKEDAVTLDIHVWEYFINRIPALASYSFEKITKTEIHKYE